MGKVDQMPVHPAPWNLQGKGYILLYRFTKQFCLRRGFIPQTLQGSFRGGLGTVMYVDYHSSDAGPYQELLFIPGRFDFSGRRYHSITKIYVSSRESVEGGRANWGIPKELASFERTPEGRNTERICIRSDGEKVAELVFRTHRPSIPVSTAMVPSGLRTLAHPWGKNTLLTTLVSKGAIAPACLTDCHINSAFFPPVDEVRPLCTVHVPHFTMVFPQARAV